MTEVFDTSGLIEWPQNTKAILLVDLDAFFASVEQLDHPEWRGLPVIVGGDPHKHGVVSTCSYEARKFGVRSAMPSSQAARLCPDAIWTSGNYPRYQEMSKKVMNILANESPYVEQVSIDEAFVDVTPTRFNNEHPATIAQRIQHNVSLLGISCSIGVGTSKAVAKIASDMDKPKGLVIVPPGSELEFLAPLPVRDMSGVGKATEKKLKDNGITTLGDIANMNRESVVALLGKPGDTLWLRAHGIDEAPMNLERVAKSISSETTFAEPLKTEEEIFASIMSMAGIVGRRARKAKSFGHTIALKIRFSNRETTSMQQTYQESIDNLITYKEDLLAMLREIWPKGSEVILVGVTLGQLHHDPSEQMSASLFDKGVDNDKASKRNKLSKATDALKERFGETSVLYGYDLRNAENTTGSIAKNSSTTRPDFRK